MEWDSKVANNTISNGIVPLEKELIVVLLYFQCDFMSASKQQNIQQALQIAQNLTERIQQSLIVIPASMRLKKGKFDKVEAI